ncbi:DUF6377 domain-containing protein [Bacteroides sp. 51]|uniref:DUF6377 domain-containing protein n=1 Tax=Bacteroides sp. 51 TaxID=2302938 RepID=UPI0013D7444C|nr:DUF6377 domain-containing protein [Bacteroides sp. 51]NDV80494.1 transcriptional regulator [Bacteroides sp. 51]
MKVKVAIICILSILLPHNLWGGNRLDSLLLVLDETINIHQTFTEEKENRINGLKAELSKAQIPEESYQWNLSLFKEYKTYICDSAIHYLNENIALAEQLEDRNKENESRLLLSLLLNSSGMFKEAIDMLETVDRHFLSSHHLTEYFLCYNNIYSELAFHTQDKASAKRYRAKANTYSDSLKAVINPNSELYYNHLEASYRNSNDYQRALEVNNIRLQKARFGTPEYALVTFHRALVMEHQGKREEQKSYLTLSALSDIQSSIKDHASLWMLAQLLYAEGDIERAYRYIRFSWNETSMYNARLRSIQSAGILSLIDKTYQGLVEKQNQKLRNYLILISVLVILLVVALAFIYKQMKKLAIARNRLQNANEQLKDLNKELQNMNTCLQSTNMELSESNHIKEEYIGRFIKLCSTYIDKLDAYRRMVNKKIGHGQTDELFAITRSPNALDEELNELYNNFDTAFLQLFPDFIAQFNSLLVEDDPIIPKKGELLNTELRIFALIRLGITDSTQIAEFLRYSLNTIYNYRAKVRNKARVPRDDFESQVINIR